ncbi:hypothetical protein AB0A77_17455 [Streptomyces varsoviensis]|uniref:hypothetical protein n=1 Tax=Streptomyces varsoviensis TaxID=67373 RepID=UPI0033CA8BD6
MDEHCAVPVGLRTRAVLHLLAELGDAAAVSGHFGVCADCLYRWYDIFLDAALRGMAVGGGMPRPRSALSDRLDDIMRLLEETREELDIWQRLESMAAAAGRTSVSAGPGH